MKNKKGFVLVETLVVTVFVMTVLTMLLVNYTPAMSEFQRREYSDDVDSKYDLYWVRKMVQSDVFLRDAKWDYITSCDSSSLGYLYKNDPSHTYYALKADDFTNASIFNNLMDNIGIAYDSSSKPILYLTKYSLAKNGLKYKKVNNCEVETGHFFKDWLFDIDHNGNAYGRSLDAGLVEYIAHLPDYNNMSMNYAEFRLIAKFKRKIDPNLEDDTNNVYYTYATIEVIRE